MENIHKFEINQFRAASMYDYFDKHSSRIRSSQLTDDEFEIEAFDIGDPNDDCTIMNIGHIEDTKYSIHLKWYNIATISNGYIDKYVADFGNIDTPDDQLCRLIVERCGGVISGEIYSAHDDSVDEFDPEAIVAYIILKDPVSYTHLTLPTIYSV